MTLSERVAALATAVAAHIKTAIAPRLVPAGGTAGQVLAKTSAANYALGWQSAAGAGVDPLDLTVTAPAAPAAGAVRIFRRDLAGRQMPAFIGPTGLDTTLQPLLARNKIAWWSAPGNATTAPGVLGIAAPTALGTATARSVATTNAATRARRLGYVSAATAGSLAGHYMAAAQYSTGNGAGLGGFFYVCRFVISDAATVVGARLFVGLRNAVAAPTNVEPNTLTQCVGVAQLSTSANLQIVYGGSAAQAAIDLGATFAVAPGSTELFDLTLFSSPQAATVSWRVEKVSTGDVATGTLAGVAGTGFPSAGTLLGHTAWRCNNATARAVGLDVSSLYIETDN